MFAYLLKLLLIARSRLKSRACLEAENLVLRQQVIVLSRKSRSRVRLRNIDRLIFVWLYRFFPSILNAITVIKPETVIRWHRRGFRAYWRWKSRRRGGRPKIDREIRDLIRRMSRETPLWGAPRIHGELLMLGIEVAQSTVARYMTRRQRPPSQGWKTFLQNHAAGIASIDLFVVRTISFKLLYGLVILRHARRRLVSISVTNNPTTEWIAGQVIGAFPWDEAPPHLIRDRDGVFGPAYTRRIRAMGIPRLAVAARRFLTQRQPSRRAAGSRFPRSSDRSDGARRFGPRAESRALRYERSPSSHIHGRAGRRPTPRRCPRIGRIARTRAVQSAQ